jgi:putative ABC transport system permease protein
MLFGETLVIAVQSIRGNLFRASLTTLGIVIGVAAVITMVALGTGARAAIDEQMEALGGDILSINSSSWFSRGVARQTNTLTTADARALAIDGRHLGGVVPEINGRQQVKYGNRNLNVTIIGTTPNYPEVHHFNLAAGRMFTEADDSARRRVAVLGSEIPGMLDGHRHPREQRIVGLAQSRRRYLGAVEHGTVPRHRQRPRRNNQREGSRRGNHRAGHARHRTHPAARTWSAARHR